MADGVSLDGVDELLARIERAHTTLPQNLGVEVYGLANEMFADSQQVVPVKQGILMNSGYVTPPEQQGDLISCTIGYGGAASDYAAKVHEMMDGHVHWTRPGSGPKYLETPVKAKQDQLPERAANAVRKSFE